MGSNANRPSFPHNIATIAMMYSQNAHSATRNNTHPTRALAKQWATRSSVLPSPSLY